MTNRHNSIKEILLQFFAMLNKHFRNEIHFPDFKIRITWSEKVKDFELAYIDTANITQEKITQIIIIIRTYNWD